MTGYTETLKYCNKMRQDNKNLYTDRGYNSGKYITKREAKKIISKIRNSFHNNDVYNSYANTNNSKFAREAKKHFKSLKVY